MSKYLFSDDLRENKKKEITIKIMYLNPQKFLMFVLHVAFKFIVTTFAEWQHAKIGICWHFKRKFMP